jgi:hypothetical protein
MTPNLRELGRFFVCLAIGIPLGLAAFRLLFDMGLIK